jgi:metal-responsive CopG/Arc/MetJ family transcriptional regulator
MKQIAIRLPQGVIEELDRIVEDEMGAVDRSTLVRQAVVDFIKKKGRPE